MAHEKFDGGVTGQLTTSTHRKSWTKFDGAEVYCAVVNELRYEMLF